MSWIASKSFPRWSCLSLLNSQKTHGARSGEYGDCGTILVENLAKNSGKIKAVCKCTSSWCKNQELSTLIPASFTNSLAHTTHTIIIYIIIQIVFLVMSLEGRKECGVRYTLIIEEGCQHNHLLWDVFFGFGLPFGFQSIRTCPDAFCKNFLNK